MNKYEILFILENDLADDSKIAIIDKLVDIVNNAGGEVVLLDKWGTKRFAYEINHKRDGYYFLMNIESNPEVPLEINRQVSITEGIVRCMVVKKDKFADLKIKKAKVASKSDDDESVAEPVAEPVAETVVETPVAPILEETIVEAPATEEAKLETIQTVSE